METLASKINCCYCSCCFVFVFAWFCFAAVVVVVWGLFAFLTRVLSKALLGLKDYGKLSRKKDEMKGGLGGGGGGGDSIQIFTINVILWPIRSFGKKKAPYFWSVDSSFP